MKKLYIKRFFTIALFVILAAYTVKVFASENTNVPVDDSGIDVQVENEDVAAAEDAIANTSPDAVENGEDVEEFKGNVEDLNDNGRNPAPADQQSEDPSADENYHKIMDQCEKQADESGDFEASIRKCMEQHGLGQDINDAEQNVF